MSAVSLWGRLPWAFAVSSCWNVMCCPWKKCCNAMVPTVSCFALGRHVLVSHVVFVYGRFASVVRVFGVYTGTSHSLGSSTTQYNIYIC